MTATPTQDASAAHWIYRLPKRWQPYAQLSRLDRPVGYWLLALPGWMGLAFAGLTLGYDLSDLVWTLLILIGAIAMRGAGCTYNDIVDQDLDAKVARTALRPLPAGNVTTRQAWTWLFIQVGIGFCVWLCLPLFAKLVALGSIPLVAAYPFMKRITWWPQLWLGMTFNWAFLVAVAIKTGGVNIPALVFYGGLIFWTVGYDTIYAMQDVEDDALIGVKSTARRFGKKIITGVGMCYLCSVALVITAITLTILQANFGALLFFWPFLACVLVGYPMHLRWQIKTLSRSGDQRALDMFKSNFWAALALFLGLVIIGYVFHGNIFEDFGGILS